MSLTFRARTCDHMIYDGACDCNELGSENFLADLSAILAEEPIVMLREPEENQADAHLADVAAEDLAEHSRLINYLEDVVREEATIENVAEEIVERDEVEGRDEVEVMDEDYFQNCDYDYGHYSPSYDYEPNCYYEQEQESYFDIADEF
jgi:hypothetical protein